MTIIAFPAVPADFMDAALRVLFTATGAALAWRLLRRSQSSLTNREADTPP